MLQNCHSLTSCPLAIVPGTRIYEMRWCAEPCARLHELFFLNWNPIQIQTTQFWIDRMGSIFTVWQFLTVHSNIDHQRKLPSQVVCSLEVLFMQSSVCIYLCIRYLLAPRCTYMDYLGTEPEGECVENSYTPMHQQIYTPYMRTRRLCACGRLQCSCAQHSYCTSCFWSLHIWQVSFHFFAA